MSDLHARFDALVATLERTFGVDLNHVKEDAPPPDVEKPTVEAPAEPAPVEAAPEPAADTPAA